MSRRKENGMHLTVRNCLVALGMLVTLSACSESGDSINVITREEGSGTREAFQKIVNLEDPVQEALIQNGTDQIISYIADDPYGIGYISLGSLNDMVKAAKVDGVSPSEETIMNGSYKISRPFVLVYREGLKEAAQDFYDFIFSKEGQDLVKKAGYVPVKQDAPSYHVKEISGTVNISGSTSVGPLMEQLKEAYEQLNPNAQIDITQNGSSAGITGAAQGTNDFGMSSRELTENEKDVTGVVMALDGIVVILNKENPLDDVSLSTIRDIYSGKLLNWKEIQ